MVYHDVNDGDDDDIYTRKNFGSYRLSTILHFNCDIQFASKLYFTSVAKLNLPIWKEVGMHGYISAGQLAEVRTEAQRTRTTPPSALLGDVMRYPVCIPVG
jgi:hypothetical protein